ncbi:MAG: ankyrin repeat domain-containing protein [Bdellovibrionia bacterium]
MPANLSLSRGDRFGVAKKVTRTSPGVLQRVNAFLPGASYAKLLAKRPFFSIVNDTVFVHGGLTLEDFAYGLPKLNEEIRQWLLGNTKFVDLPERASNTIAGRGGDNSVWNRKYSMGNPSAAHCELLKPIFAALGVKRMVVGHTIQDQGINEACEGKVWRIDIALSRGYSYVNPQVLAIDDNQIKILAPKSIDLRDEDSMAPLHIAAQNGHTVKVKELLLAGADKNMPTYQGVTPILFAASNDQLKVVHTLTEAKVDCDKSDIFGWTPLIAAVVNQNVLIVDALLRAGANKDKANQDGWTPIAIAADKGNLEVTRRLIREKVDLEKASREGFTPLAQAVARGRESIVTLLLKEGANPLRVGKNNISILDLAERGPNRKIEKLIRNAIK